MIYEFVHTSVFKRRCQQLGVGVEETAAIEQQITQTGLLWPVIAGTHGLRKMRFARPGRGKSGGARVLYFIVDEAQHVYLVSIYDKNELANITPADKQQFAKLVAAIRGEYRRR